ncbi:helix-turn-helix transcriptional regulator [Veillonella sp. R32]|uniref:helix-turn-helix domain-containing protein n=1 Tax=Veillonella sp. R32 TaxID=2021312 RepID=UPI00138A2AAF|nr:helix-turn-helix transcriptional regulator [Veillonella sp. R32]KAF1682589.1 hypothetical protein VER_05125 [Veillonella sp. R32]
MIICKLKDILEERDIKKSVFAKEAGLTRPFTENLLTNSFKDLNVDSLNRAISYLNLDGLNDLFIYIPLEVENLKLVRRRGKEFDNAYYLTFDITDLNSNTSSQFKIEFDFKKAWSQTIPFSIVEVSSMENNSKWSEIIEVYGEELKQYILGKLQSYIEMKLKTKIFLMLTEELKKELIEEVRKQRATYSIDKKTKVQDNE